MVHTLFLTDSRNFNPAKYMAYTVYDIFYDEIQWPSEPQVYMPYINLPTLIGMLRLLVSSDVM